MHAWVNSTGSSRSVQPPTPFKTGSLLVLSFPCTVGRMTLRLTRRILNHLRSLVRYQHPLICLARALLCAHSFACTTRELASSWEGSFCPLQLTVPWWLDRMSNRPLQLHSSIPMILSQLWKTSHYNSQCDTLKIVPIPLTQQSEWTTPPRLQRSERASERADKKISEFIKGHDCDKNSATFFMFFEYFPISIFLWLMSHIFID